MKISKSDLVSLIHEVIDERLTEDDDKFTTTLDLLNKKRQDVETQSAKLGVDIAKVKLAQAQSQEKSVSDTLDNAENRGEDISQESNSLNNAKEKTKKAKDGVSAANDKLKASQKGGTIN